MTNHYLRTVTGALVLSLGFGAAALGQQRSATSYFRDDATAGRSALGAALRHSRSLRLDAAGLRAALATAPPETRPGAAPLTLALPLPDGSTGRFAVVETAIMAPALAAQFPQIKTYRGVGLDDPAATVRLDMTPQGFHAQILSATTSTVYLDPATRGDQQHVLSFYRRDMDRTAAGNPGSCQFQPTAAEEAETQRLAAGSNTAQRTLIAAGPTLRTYRLAVAATGEYTTFQGGTLALAQAAIVTTVNRVVGVYEKELAVRLQLIGTNNTIIYTNASTDPYTNGNPNSMIGENQTNVDAVIGASNYDIGHVFGTNSGGLAGLRVVCVAGNKARGVTGSGAPVGDAFDIDYVAHEMGHQFGGNHSFNSASGSCNGNRSAARAYEPGSGSTIMSYAGICSPDNLQNNSDAYFHSGNFEEMATFIASTTCGTSTATGNTAPTVFVPAVRTLPIATPFRLTASATDAEGDALTYNWEQMDLGLAGALTDAQVANDNEPLFRSFTATTSPTRVFPRLASIIANTSSTSERLPTVTRTLTFRCTARDQHNGSAGVVGGINYSASVALPVTSAAGPFLVTAPNTAVSWGGGSTQTVTWNVAGTTANGVNCATVNILLSTDGGLTYPTTLVSGTANDGSQTVTLPNVPTTTARIMVEAADNYFFDISNTNFTITAAVATAAPVVVTPANGSLTNNPRPPFSGTAPSGSTVTVYVDAISRGTATTDASGNWTLTLTSDLAEGVRQVYATAQSSGQTVSANSNTNTFTVDTTPPPAPVAVTPANGSRTNDNTPAYSGTAEANATVTLLVDGTSVGTTTATASGNFSFVQPTALADGSHTVKARSTDAAGNTSVDSNTNTFTVDTTAPTVVISSLAGASGSSTATAPIPFTVTFSEAVTGFVAGEVTATNGTVGNFAGSGSTYTLSVTPTAAGTVTVNVAANVAQDAANNGNTAATQFNITYAPTAPDLTISTGTQASPVSVAAGTYNSITVTGTGFAQLGGAVVVNSAVTVQTNGALNTACQSLTGAGSFTLQAGATLYVCNLAGITSSAATGAVQLTGGRSFSNDANYIYNGSGAQATGNGLPAQVRNLTSTNTATLTLTQALAIREVLTLNAGSLNLNAQTLTLLSDAAGTALVANLGAGSVLGTTVTVQRYIDPTLNPGLGYRHLAAPVANATVAAFGSGGTTLVVNSAYNTSATPNLTTPFPTIFRYDQSRLASSPATTLSTFDKGWVSPTSLSDAAGLATTGFTVQLPGASTLSFTGQVGNSSGAIPLARASGATAADAGLNLIGNPYPSPLDFSSIPAGQRVNMDAAFYTFESTSQYGGNYRSYVNGIGNPLVGTAQAFFVRVSAGQTSGSLALNNANRVTTYNQQAPVRRDTRPLVQLTLKPAGGTTGDAAFVYFEAGATDAFDSQYDAEKLPNSSGLNLSTSLSPTQRLSIDGRGLLGTGQKVIPLAVGVPAVGNYSLNAAQLLNMSPVDVFLRDVQTGAVIDLAQQSSYSFTVTNASALITGRFELVFAPQRPTATTAAHQLQLNVWPNPVAGQAELHLSLSKPLPAATATLRDVVGRTVATRAFSGTSTSLPTAGLAAGTYLLSVSAAGQSPVTRRVVVE